MDLSDFIDPKDEAVGGQEPEAEASAAPEEIKPEAEPEAEAEAAPEEIKPETEPEAEAEADKYGQLLARYGTEEDLQAALDFREAFIKGGEDEEAIVAFAGNLHKLSPDRYSQFVNTIVETYAPKMGYEKPEAAGDEGDDEGLFEDDAESERYNALLQEKAELQARLNELEGKQQQTQYAEAEEAFMESVGAGIEQMISSLGLHPEIASEALQAACNAAAGTPDFATALDAVRRNDGERPKLLTRSVLSTAQTFLETNAAKYVRLSNALKTVEANHAPKAEQKDALPVVLQQPPAAQIKADIAEKRALPRRGAPLSEYV